MLTRHFLNTREVGHQFLAHKMCLRGPQCYNGEHESTYIELFGADGPQREYHLPSVIGKLAEFAFDGSIYRHSIPLSAAEPLAN